MLSKNSNLNPSGTSREKLSPTRKHLLYSNSLLPKPNLTTQRPYCQMNMPILIKSAEKDLTLCSSESHPPKASQTDRDELQPRVLSESGTNTCALQKLTTKEHSRKIIPLKDKIIHFSKEQSRKNYSRYKKKRNLNFIINKIRNNLSKQYTLQTSSQNFNPQRPLEGPLTSKTSPTKDHSTPLQNNTSSKDDALILNSPPKNDTISNTRRGNKRKYQDLSNSSQIALPTKKTREKPIENKEQSITIKLRGDSPSSKVTPKKLKVNKCKTVAKGTNNHQQTSTSSIEPTSPKPIQTSNTP